MTKLMRKFTVVAMVLLIVGSVGLWAQTNTAAADAVIKALPADMQSLYGNLGIPVATAAYDSYKPPKGPWKIGYADSYQGNPWRVSVKDELFRLADSFKKLGKVASIESKVSNNDVSQEIANIRSFINKKVDIIILNPETPTGLNGVIKEAFDAGIPVVTIAASVTSPYAINVDNNFGKWGYDMADYIGRSLNGKGNVLMVEGIAGVSIVDYQKQGYDAAMKKYPGVKTILRVNGNWTLSVTKQVVLQALATTSASGEKIDAVWTTGSEARVVFEAFKEAGQPVPLVTGSITGDSLGYWKENGDAGFKYYGFGVLPHATAQAGFRVAMRILEGQNPKLTELLIPLPEVKQADLSKWYAPGMTTDTTSIFPLPPVDPISEKSLNAYFVKGKALAGYDYSQALQASK